MSSHGIRLAIGSLALCFASSAGAQGSLEQGKTGGQLYAANCASCHKSPQSVTKATGIFGLESFLRGQLHAQLSIGRDHRRLSKWIGKAVVQICARSGRQTHEPSECPKTIAE